MYNKIAYGSLLICWIIIMLFLLDDIFLCDFVNDKHHLLIFIGVSFSSLYYKLHTTPITEALSKWWEKRNKKSEEQKVENSEIKTYQDYKNHES